MEQKEYLAEKILLRWFEICQASIQFKNDAKFQKEYAPLVDFVNNRLVDTLGPRTGDIPAADDCCNLQSLILNIETYILNQQGEQED